MFLQGNEAVGWGAVSAGCLYFFGYPITPQNEIPEWFARELPGRGGVFVQSQSESGSINMLMGAGAAGVRALTSTSSPGWGLMQEGISHMATAELPCVILLVQRGGPGAGSIRHSQMDYLSATRGGGQGGYKNVVLAPASVQESCDLIQLAFHLADKYRNPTIVLSDGIIGQMAEVVEVETIDFGPLPPKDWALRGRQSQPDGKRRLLHSAPGSIQVVPYVHFVRHLGEKFQEMKQAELRYESYQTEDAEVVIVAYGYAARVSKEAVNMARGQGLKVGLLRPITLWPFPYQAIREKALKGSRFLVVEDSLGLMIEDVEIGSQGRAQTHLVSILDRHIPTDGGMILPGRVFEEARKLL